MIDREIERLARLFVITSIARWVVEGKQNVTNRNQIINCIGRDIRSLKEEMRTRHFRVDNTDNGFILVYQHHEIDVNYSKTSLRHYVQDYLTALIKINEVEGDKMCGRFTVFDDFNTIISRFNLNFDEALGLDYVKRYNIAPSQDVLAIVNDGNANRLGHLRWGLIPSWAKDKKIGYKMINARAETIDEKPAFRKLLQRRRCLIPADGFYEWHKHDGKKTPMRITLKTRELFAFAGLWDRWENNGEVIQSCTIITTKPNSLMSDIHDRMPAILTKSNEAIWLDRTSDDPIFLKSLLTPYPVEKMEAFEVARLVNKPANDSPEIINPT